MSERIHNFRSNRWGHNQMLKRSGEMDGEGNPLFSGLVISTPVVREGDIIQWPTEYGSARLLVEKTTYVRDPDDMTQVDRARIVERIGPSGETLWLAHDRAAS